MSGDRISGILKSDAMATHRVFNRAASLLAPADESIETIARRFRVMAGWFLEASDELLGVSAEERGVAETDAFWKRRAAGERGGGDA